MHSRALSGGEKENLSSEELQQRNMYLEGKIDILQKNSLALRQENDALKREKSSGVLRALQENDALKSELRALQREVRARENQLMSVKKARTHPSAGEDDPRRAALPMEWVLRHAPERVTFELSPLTHERLKIFGRFFKAEFDRIYDAGAVIREIGGSLGNTRSFVKSLVYLADRREVISHFLPYLFKRHLLAGARAHSKDILRIIAECGVGCLLEDAELIKDIRLFIQENSQLEDVARLLMCIADAKPRALIHLLPTGYLAEVASANPLLSLSLIRRMESAGLTRAIGHQPIEASYRAAGMARCPAEGSAPPVFFTSQRLGLEFYF